MKELSSNIGVVILAAGHGTRMNSELPKVMHPLHGKPIIGHMVDAVIASGVTDKPVVVVSPQSDLIREYLGEKVAYAVQEKQLGTAHATAAAEDSCAGVDQVLVLYGDLPFLSAKTIARFATFAKEHIVMGTTTVPDFEEERKAFVSFGKIIRDNDGKVIDIREKKDCNEKEAAIRELNTGLYAFPAGWLFEHVKKTQPNNAQAEQYLTDVIFMAMKEGLQIDTVDVPVRESFGISSQEDLAIAHALI
ncbi:MAG: hypothetical protein CO030_01780 [Candidatus Magasanikbacteria bacterium CG_4_9_14_0_2_um_filter_42_11]|uniref:MobA-like NTP transferase domain-containing protein n=1 Tax=Candidatus Magasanikbacteria bacterium CG_4_9_14_0_2_um_filter_42_11 TaxID=1974643 RepID=A0A2M8FA79_9BACT|nr:MAG: hypothetical protein COU34_05340 [Candidatus Magasanikbacteria bacterium CG10_big_fil_rev_8_21_14_0_10_43_9]PIY92729.1 MAG: hypothetical protein COY70_01755 [Candidatus Magasanikbacteria bacterium CG_4_10_14_0_8_um_filter_42_12]PJC52644.1 MAG: hypothetical protein CO030_01780 [Candidatus Magasanikbacteria bacterium CG_4_9_14_0_2_um_filter_42_11]